jgi:translocation and assembly module TamB
MVKRLLLITLSVLLLLAAGLVAGVWWLLSTSEGSRWFLAELSRRSAVTVEARQIDGRLLDRLRLEGARVSWPGGTARFDDVELIWRPAALLRGHLTVDELSLAGGEVAWVAPPAGKEEGVEGAAGFAWPRLAGWPLRLRASIGALRIENIELQPPAGERQRLERLTARVDWHDGIFSIAALDAAAAGYRLQGSAAAGLARPLLRLDLQLGLSAPAAGMDGLALHADLVPDAAGFAGPLTLQGRSGAETRLQLAAELALDEDTLRLRRFELTQPGRRGTLSGEGEVRLPGGAPKWRLRATVADLDLGPETGVTTDLAGTVEGAGEGTDYRGSFDLANRAPDWRSARLAGPFAGDADGMSFPQLAGSWLRGELAGDLRLAWREGFALTGSLRGRRLDPAVFVPEWPGQVNLDLAGDLAIPTSGPRVAHLNGRLLDSTLRGRALTGMVKAELAGDDLRLAALELHGDGFDLSGSGRLAERIDFRAEIVRLSGLLPTAQGALAAQGWLRWRDGKLAGEIVGHGRQLAYGNLHVGTLQLTARLPGDSPTVAGNLHGSGIIYGRWHLQSVGLNLSGSLQKHVLDMQARWPGGELQAAAAGGWQDGRWTGTLQRLDGQDAGAGPWRLAGPAGLEVAADRLRISSLRLAGRGSEGLRLDGSLAWRAGMGEGEAQWEEIDLSRFNPWLAEMALAGNSSGETRVRWQENRPLELSGRLSATGGMTHGEQVVNVRHLSAEFAWTGTGLHAELAATLEEGGGLDARFATSEPLRADFPRQGEAKVEWQDLDLSLLDPWLKPAAISGRSSGESHLRWQADGSLVLEGRADAAGTLVHDEMQLAVRQIETEFDWNADGLRATVVVELEEGGRFNGRVQSAQPGRLALPERGHIEADWAELDLARLRPWLPEGFDLKGRLGGKASGDWLPGGHLALAGEAAVDQGRLSWRTEDGEVAADLRTARFDWEWRGETLAGELELALAEYGEAKGTFRLPLPARLPVALNPAGSLQVTLEAKAREQGLLAAVFPGLVQKSRGELELHAQVGGTWQDPDLAGTVHLSGAGAYFPTAGIELREVALTGELAGDELRIVSFSARSGPGQVNGNGSVSLQHWRPAAYRGTLKGERFEAVHLPELQLLVNPDLTFEGTAERLQVRGEVRLPELTVLGREQRGVVRESPDVVIVGGAEPAERVLPLALDIQVHVVLGDHVLVKVAGVDARLTGELDLRVAGPETITGRGQISVAQGTYSTYGAQLKIVRGRLLYSGGPIDQPTFDILALRTVGEVKAGVQVSGTPRTPVVKLYSEPGMPDTDVLAYIILGHPLGEDSGQAGLLTAAAGALLARGESAVLQDRIKRRLGVDVLAVEGSGDVAGSMVTIGKYLSPKLYLSFGQSLFANASEARLRYSISKKWELESKAGAESSGVDLYYKIEFE